MTQALADYDPELVDPNETPHVPTQKEADAAREEDRCPHCGRTD